LTSKEKFTLPSVNLFISAKNEIKENKFAGRATAKITDHLYVVQK
jgi:hypothetical protein